LHFVQLFFNSSILYVQSVITVAAEVRNLHRRSTEIRPLAQEDRFLRSPSSVLLQEKWSSIAMSRFSIDRLSVLKRNNAGRMSMLLNEDDYDYALELRPDDEYRYDPHTTR
jgi:hypothetical protein